MDGMNSNFGNLSLRAAEWKPSQQHSNNTNNSSTATTNSDLNPGQVKEFIPGQGWSDSTASNVQVADAVPNNTTERQSGMYKIHTRILFYFHNGSLIYFFVFYFQNVNVGKVYETSIPAGPLPSPISFRSLHSMSVSDELYRHYRNLSLECIRQMDPSDPQHKAIPLPYCNAYCLDDSVQQKRRGRSSFGYPTSTFQVTNREDGNLYCIKRFDSVRSVSPKIAQQITDRWSIATVHEHPSIVPFYQCFLTHRAVFFVYQYVPGARTLSEYVAGPLAESIVWSCISQLVSAIRVIHGNDLAVRTLRLQQCLCNTDSTGTRLRIRIGSVGIIDALEFESRKHIIDLQIEDIRDLGRLILSLATGTEINPTSDAATIGQCEQFLIQNYSRELHNLCMTLIRGQPRPPTIIDVSRATAIHSVDEQDAVYKTLDRTERALSSEYESGRALRLLLKLNFVNERPELGPNRRWAQSGDCYILNLFRDYGTLYCVIDCPFLKKYFLSNHV
jgi:PAB-dependent poly(A)-specific ribonuclease subunit 3